MMVQVMGDACDISRNLSLVRLNTHDLWGGAVLFQNTPLAQGTDYTGRCCHN